MYENMFDDEIEETRRCIYFEKNSMLIRIVMNIKGN
jgi:hypothetical protein